MRKIEKVKIILVFLHERYKERHGTQSPFRVLVSTVLSQRTRDEITDIATERLFSLYDTPQKLVDASLWKIEDRIKPVGFYHTKAKRLKEISLILIQRYNGNVPGDIDELLSLPGVGRKTANCVLVYGFGIPALAVDTHVHRISNRVGLVDTRNPHDTEVELSKIVPIREFGFLNTSMVRFGKEICKPLYPLCKTCGIKNICDRENRQSGRRCSQMNKEIGLMRCCVNGLSGHRLVHRIRMGMRVTSRWRPSCVNHDSNYNLQSAI